MKHFYNPSSAANILQSTASPLGTALCGKILTLLLLGFFLLVSGEGFGQATFTAKGSGSWSDASTWQISNRVSGTNTIPSQNDDVIINSDGFHIRVNSTTPASCATLTLSAPNGNRIVTLTIEGGRTLSIKGKTNIANSLVLSDGNNPGSKANVNINGILEVVSGNISIQESSTVVLGSSGILEMAGPSITVATTNQRQGKLDAINGKVVYKGLNQNIFPTQYKTLELVGSGIKTATGGIQVEGNLTISAVTFAASSYEHIVKGDIEVSSITTGPATNRSTGVFDAERSTVRLSGSYTNRNGSIFNKGTSTVEYNGTGTTQEIENLAYHNLTLSGSGTKTVKAALALSGNLLINSGPIFNAGNFTHAISGNFLNAGTFNAGIGTFIMNGDDKTISSSGTGAFYNLVVTNKKTLLSDITVNNSISVNNGILDTQDNAIVLGVNGNVVSTENSSQHIKGAIETTRSLSANRSNSETFGNIGLRIPPNTQNLGSIKVRRLTGKAFNSPLTGYNSVNRQFYVTSTNNPALDDLNTAIEMDFPDHDLTGQAPYNIYRVTGADNSTIDKLENASSSTGLFGYVVANAQKFGMYTLSSIITPLPVELISFKAQRHTRGVNLTWVTASEQENKGFEIEVSTDSKAFQAIGFVESKVGTTSIRQDYSFLDTKAVSGTRYYRLKQVDLDGTFTYSAIRAVSLDGDNGKVTVYPNPFDDVVTVKLNGMEARQVRAVLSDAMGKVVLETVEETAGNTITVNTASVTSKGMYMLHVLDNGQRHIFKLMKR